MSSENSTEQQWEGYAHVIFTLAREFEDLAPVSTTSFFPAVQRRDYSAGGHGITFINYGYFEDPELQRRGVALIEDASNEGGVVYLSSELADGPLDGELATVDVVKY